MLFTQRRLWGISIIFFVVFLILIINFVKISEGFHNRINVNTTFKKAKYHFVLIAQQYDNPYFQMVKQGAMEAAKQNNAIIEYVGPLRNNTEEYIQFIDKAITERVDGIITQGLSNQQFTPIINKAINAGIPVITYDTDDPDSKRISYVGTDNYQAGILLGQAVIKTLEGSGNIAIITGSLDANNQIQRVQGMLDVLKKYPKIHVVDIRVSQISRIQAAAEMEYILTHDQKVSLVVGTSATDALGINDALRTYKNSQIKIIGFDDLPETVSLLKQGKVSGTVVQEPKKMGAEAVNLMVQTINKKEIPKEIYTGVNLMTPQNYK